MTSEPRITYVGHATVLIEMDGKRILTDPILRNRIGHISRSSKPLDLDLFRQVDAVLISHMHYDHLDMPSLRFIGRETRIIAPKGTAPRLRADGFHHVKELRAGDTTNIGDIVVSATHADHDGGRHPFSEEADTLGFVLRGDATVYFAGDTDIFPEMKSIGSDLDLVLLPVWGWGPTLGEGHMTPERAAEALRLLRPRAAMPIHWGTFAPMGFSAFQPRFLTDPPFDFADHAKRMAPEVDVHIIAPGRNLRLPGRLSLQSA